MMKRQNIIALSFAALSLGFTSCDDFLDKLPDNRMELKKTDDLNKLLVTAYPQTHPAYLLEMYSDNSDEYNRPGWEEADRFQSQAYKWEDIQEIDDPETPQEIWNAHYTAVSAANEVINFINKAGNDPQYDPQKGEALLCRAYAMFQLANVFCMAYDEATAATYLGMPYPEVPETSIGVKYERGTLKDLYEKIEKDIEEGLKKVGNTYDQPKYHFTQQAANAFAARFYLYYKKYDKAIACANAVLGDNAASKLRDWRTWGNLSRNQQIQPTAFTKSGEKANLLIQPVQSEWGAICGPYSYGQKYAHGMLISETETLQAEGPWGNNSTFLWKYFYNSSVSSVNVRKIGYHFEYTDIQAGIGYAHCVYVPFTTDETLLVRAEAYALSGNNNAALDDLNTSLHACYSANKSLTIDGIRDFYAGIKDFDPKEPTVKKPFHTSMITDTDTQEPLLQAIINLRRLMFVHEGLRMQDIKRYGITIHRRIVNSSQTVTDVYDTMESGDPRLAIQLPQDVITAGLTPNPRNK